MFHDPKQLEKLNEFSQSVAAQFCTIVEVLVNQGLCTQEEYVKRFAFWTHHVDQKVAARKDEMLKELEKTNPVLAKAQRAMDSEETDPLKALLAGVLEAAKAKKPCEKHNTPLCEECKK